MGNSKVTRIVYGKDLNAAKFNQLVEIADRLGKLRTEIWRRFGSINGIGVSHRIIRDQWLAEQREFDTPARLWKETLRDTLGDINAYCESAKEKVRRAIRKRTKDDKERKRLYTLLKFNKWLADPYLRRMMRKHFKHGRTKVRNQIVLDTGCYKTFEMGGQAWIAMMGLDRGKRIAIPLNTIIQPTGTLRLIIRDNRVEIHYAIDEKKIKSCGSQVLGIDKGYTEAFTDSDGDRHGEGLGELLSKESDALKIKYQRRNKLKAIASKKPHKREKIQRNNLGRKKLDRRKKRHRSNVRDKVYKATHSVVDKAKTIVCEDLTFNKKGSKFSKDQNRRLSGWVKGILAEAINSVSRRRCSSVVLISASYTSQVDSRHGVLLGQRSGDRFYCFDGAVLDSDINAAQNILSRKDDGEITLFMSAKDVKAILVKRTEEFKERLGLLNPGSSCIPTIIGASTECESPDS